MGDAIEALVADLNDNADIDEAEGCNPRVVALERRAAITLAAQATELAQVKAERDALSDAGRNLLNCCERHGLAKDLMAKIWPEGRDPSNKETWSDSARDARRYMNEMRAALALRKEASHG